MIDPTTAALTLVCLATIGGAVAAWWVTLGRRGR
jgi:hypothetical protein